jgi:hypothetical protein
MPHHHTGNIPGSGFKLKNETRHTITVIAEISLTKLISFSVT